MDGRSSTVACSSFIASIVHITNIPLSRTTVNEAFVGGSMALLGPRVYAGVDPPSPGRAGLTLAGITK